tara:strand:+ start:10615 stop:10995 length:381 start_codon:yes stop_codon:yes gene_type:complete
MTDIDRSGFISLEVEENSNCYGMPLMTYQAIGTVNEIQKVKVYGLNGSEEFQWVTGWNSDMDGTPLPAFCVEVSDSGSGNAFLVFGSDWGLRMMHDSLDEKWSSESKNQFGEPWMLIGDMADIVSK